MKDKRMIQLSILSVLLSMCMAVWTSLLVSFYISTMAGNKEWTQQEKTNNALFTFIPLALGEVVGSFLLGFTYDKLGPKHAVSFLLVVSVLEISSAIAYNEIHEFNFFAYVVSFGWGILDSGLNNFMNITLGFEFKSKITPFSA